MDQTESKKVKAYDYHFPMESEIDLHKALIVQYSAAQLTMGKVPVLLRDQLATLLAIYLKHGYSQESKNLALKILKLEHNNKLIDALNHDLKKLGYLLDDPMNKRLKRLNPDLQLLKEYIDQSPGNQYVIRYFIYLK